MSAAQLLASARKAVAAAAAGLTVMTTAGLLTGQPAAWATGAIATVAATLAVYAAPPNIPPPPEGPTP